MQYRFSWQYTYLSKYQSSSFEPHLNDGCPQSFWSLALLQLSKVLLLAQEQQHRSSRYCIDIHRNQRRHPHTLACLLISQGCQNKGNFLSGRTNFIRPMTCCFATLAMLVLSSLLSTWIEVFSVYTMAISFSLALDSGLPTTMLPDIQNIESMLSAMADVKFQLTVDAMYWTAAEKYFCASSTLRSWQLWLSQSNVFS
jgi:hypothetical protein